MKFWTAFQAPLHQAALIDNGNIVCSVPDHPPQTPVRMVGPVSEWDDKHILIGRRNSVEMWTRDAATMIKQVTHPWIYGFHGLKRWHDKILIGCAGPDCVFLLDWDGNVHWSWFAYKEGLSVDLSGYPVPFGEGAKWLTFQLTQGFELKGSSHLNSLNIDKEDILVTFLRSSKAVRLRVGEPRSLAVYAVHGATAHDYQIDPRDGKTVVVGLADGLRVGSKMLFKRIKCYIKRVRPFGEDGWIFTFESGVVAVSGNGKIIYEITLPRPWNIVNLES